MTAAERAELAVLRDKLERRSAAGGFKHNVLALEARIAQLEAKEARR